jgi:hypothetical protein
MTIQQKLDSFSMVLADNIRANNEMINEFEALQKEVKELQELQKQPVTANWYDFTDEQKEHLGEIVNHFIDSLTRNMRSVDVDLSEGSVNVNITLDLQDLIEDALPYGISDKFQEYLEDEITESRKEQQQDC